MSPAGPTEAGVGEVRRLVRLTVAVVAVLVAAGLAVLVVVDRVGDGGTVGVPGASSSPGGATDEGDGPDERFLPEGFGEALVTVTAADGETCELCVLTASTGAARSQGLMDVSDPGLGGYDGMLFEYESDTASAFWMRNTPLPLSIAWFDVDGALVATADMEPCPDDVADAGCPRHSPGQPFRSALEVPQGRLEELAVRPGSTLQVDARACPGAVVTS